MPHMNRVTPFGELVAYPEYGTFMGNRGILHDDQGQIAAARWRHRRWITCLLDFKGRRRPIMTPGNYTELFFLDEATAFAAGHRPCGECRRADLKRFLAYWHQANAGQLGNGLSLDEIDRQLHRERVYPRSRRQVTYQENLALLPDGTFITLEGQIAYLVWEDALREWSPAGYSRSLPRVAGAVVTVLTPRSVVRTFAAGYRPMVFELPDDRMRS